LIWQSNFVSKVNQIILTVKEPEKPKTDRVGIHLFILIMKKTIHFRTVFTIVFVLFLFNTYSQESMSLLDTDLEVQSYKKMKVPSTYSSEVRDEDKANFKKLRDFLNRKKNLLITLNNAELDTYVNPLDISDNEQFIKKLSKYIEGKSDNFSIPLDDLNDIYNYKYDTSYDQKYKIKDLKDNLETLQKKKIEYANKNKEHDFLVKNIEIVNQDITLCQNQIDTALDPENRKQEFKMTMSICFVGLIGILLISFFLIVYLKSDITLSKDLLGGYGLQFITLFVLIIAIILFGILDILKGSELAAMLSGISGYILGKGIQDKKVGLDSSTTTIPTTPPPPNDPTTVVQNPVIQGPVIQDSIIQNPVIQGPITQDPIIPEPYIQDPENPNQKKPE
jgi:hypothetical protein